MSRDIEREFKELRDSVNSGLIDDELSRLVGEARKTAPAARQALPDDEAELIAAAGSPWQNMSMDEYLEWYKSILKSVKTEIEGAVTRHQDLGINPGADSSGNETIEVQEFI